jgi:hypothetical protein
MDASAAAEAPTNSAEADNAVCKALLNRDPGNWAKTIERQPPSNNVAELLQRLSVNEANEISNSLVDQPRKPFYRNAL